MVELNSLFLLHQDINEAPNYKNVLNIFFLVNLY